MKQRVLITGATGFLGSHLTRQLVERDYKVTALVRNPDTAAAQELPKAVKRVKGDILDGASVKRAAKGCHVLMHCAGKVSRDTDDALELQKINVQGTKVTFDAAREAGIGRAVLASTTGTVAISTDSKYNGTEEDDPPLHLINRWPYYRSKYYAEQEALERNNAAFEVVIVNPSLLLGPGDRYGSSTEDVKLFLQERIPAVPPGGIAFVDARDAATGMILAMEKGRPGRRYFLSSSNCELRVFFDRLGRVSGVTPPWITMPNHELTRTFGLWLVEKGAELLGPDAVPDPASVDMGNHFWYADSTRAEEELGWTYRDPIDTLLDTVDDLRERGSVRARKGILEYVGNARR